MGQARREQLVQTLSGFVLREGLQAASLRPLAAEAGTSDRMLLYYFENKDELIEAILVSIAGQLQVLLDHAIPRPMPRKTLLPELLRLIRRPDVRPYLQLWIELAGRSGRGEEPFRRIAGAISDGFLLWTKSRLGGRIAKQGDAPAAELLCLLEGAVLFDAMGRGGIGDLAASGR